MGPVRQNPIQCQKSRECRHLRTVNVHAFAVCIHISVNILKYWHCCLLWKFPTSICYQHAALGQQYAFCCVHSVKIKQKHWLTSAPGFLQTRQLILNITEHMPSSVTLTACQLHTHNHKSRRYAQYTFSPKTKKGDLKVTTRFVQLTDDLCTRAALLSVVSTLRLPVWKQTFG